MEQRMGCSAIFISYTLILNLFIYLFIQNETKMNIFNDKRYNSQKR